ncbi:PucR family transcriptional regulator [Microbacterium soli]
MVATATEGGAGDLRRTAAHGALPTVREILRLDVVVEGVPEVLSGSDALDEPVRWVHVSDSAGVARLLDGGELLLSTGSGWPQDPDALRAFITELVAVGVAGLIVELGSHYRWVPAVIIDAARAHGLVLVVLHHEVKYVTITEAVHRLIIDRQTAALRARDEVRERFTTLILRGSPADFVVRQLASTLGAPVVLENLAHEVVADDVPPAREEELLSDWERLSRAAHRGGLSCEPMVKDWLVVPVEARGSRWGHLVALPGPEHPAGRLAVLQQGAIALALGRLADGQVDEWERQARGRLLDRLLAGRYTGAAGAAARLDAAGFPIRGRRLFGLVISRAEVSTAAADAAAQAIRGRVIVGAAPARTGGRSAALLMSLPPEEDLLDETVITFARAAAGDGAVVSVGFPATGLDEALLSLREAIELSRGGSVGGPRTMSVRRTDARPLVRLVTSLREDHRLLEHGDRMLAPLVEHDLRRGGDLLDVLEAMLAHPTNRTAAAAASHLSRSVFYQRIALIEQLLGLDLDDGETQTALHLALLVRRGGVMPR